jgi:hypothetical protein
MIKGPFKEPPDYLWVRIYYCLFVRFHTACMAGNGEGAKDLCAVLRTISAEAPTVLDNMSTRRRKQFCAVWQKKAAWSLEQL